MPARALKPGSSVRLLANDVANVANARTKMNAMMNARCTKKIPDKSNTCTHRKGATFAIQNEVDTL